MPRLLSTYAKIIVLWGQDPHRTTQSKPEPMLIAVGNAVIPDINTVSVETVHRLSSLDTCSPTHVSCKILSGRYMY